MTNEEYNKKRVEELLKIWVDCNNCTINNIPCDCKDCSISGCEEYECSICGFCDEYWKLGTCPWKRGIENKE